MNDRFIANFREITILWKSCASINAKWEGRQPDMLPTKTRYGQISQPKHKKAADSENRLGVLFDWLKCCPSRFRKFRHWSSQFWRNQNKIIIFRGVLGPSNLKFSSTENFRTPLNLFCFVLVPSKLTALMSEVSNPRRTTLKSTWRVQYHYFHQLQHFCAWAG